MKYIINGDVVPECTDLPDDERYSIEAIRRSDILPASYTNYYGTEGGTDLMAMPIPRNWNAIMQDNLREISDYDPHTAATLPYADKCIGILQLKNTLYPLRSQLDFESKLLALVKYVYQHRKLGEFNVVAETGAVLSTHGSYCNTSINSSVPGFSMIGTAGTGKSTSAEVVLERIPKAIHHKLPDVEYVQIPIVSVNAAAHSSIKSMYIAIADQIDQYLCCGHAYHDAIAGKDVSRGTQIIASWIQQLHIAVLVIDEVEFMEFSASSSRSFNVFINLSESTGVGLVLIGTPETYKRWGKKLMQLRRVASEVIRTDLFDTAYMHHFQGIIDLMWGYQWVKHPLELTDEVRDEICRQTNYSIDLLGTMLMMIQYEALNRKKSITDPLAFIREVADKRIKKMAEMAKTETRESETAYYDTQKLYREEIRASIKTKMTMELSESCREIVKEDSLQAASLIKKAVNIVSTVYVEYSSKHITHLARQAIAQEPSLEKLPVERLVQAIRIRINNEEEKKKLNNNSGFKAELTDEEKRETEALKDQFMPKKST